MGIINSITKYSMRISPRTTNYIANKIGRVMTTRLAERCLGRPYNLYEARGAAVESLGVNFRTESTNFKMELYSSQINFDSLCRILRVLEDKHADPAKFNTAVNDLGLLREKVISHLLAKGPLSNRLLSAMLSRGCKGELLVLLPKGDLVGARQPVIANVLIEYLTTAADTGRFPRNWAKSIYGYFFYDSLFLPEDANFLHMRNLLYRGYLEAMSIWNISSKLDGGKLSIQDRVQYAFMLLSVELKLQRQISDPQRITLAREAAQRAAKFAVDNNLSINMGKYMLALINAEYKQTDVLAGRAVLRRWIPMYFVMKNVFGRYFDCEQPPNFDDAVAEILNNANALKIGEIINSLLESDMTSNTYSNLFGRSFGQAVFPV